MMRSFFLLLPKTFFLLSLLFLISCKKYKSPFFQEVLKKETGHFRGVKIGDSINFVGGIEDKSFLRDQMGGYLHYDYNLNMGNGYTVTYDFSESNLLYEIEIAVYLDQITDANILFDDFSKFFTKKYDQIEKENTEYITWENSNTEDEKSIEVSMINNSNSFGYLSIIIRDANYL